MKKLSVIGIVCLVFSLHARTAQELFYQGVAYYKQDKLDDALAAYLAAEPTLGTVSALYNCAFILNVMGRFSEAIPFYNKVLLSDPHHEAARYGRAKCYLALGDFEQGWPEFEWRFGNPQYYHEQLRYSCLRPADLVGKKIIIRQEFGFGDTIQMIRYARLLHDLGATVYAQVPTALAKLLGRCSFLAGVIGDDVAVPHGMNHHIPLMSLPYIFKTRLDTIPAFDHYLEADPGLVDYWQQQLPKNSFKIGICWKGKPGHVIEKSSYTSRPVALSIFKQLAQFENITLISLQQVDGLGEIEQVASQVPIITFDGTFDKDHGRFMDTAAVMKNCDLIISTDTSLVHLAGALGVPVWVMVPYTPEWRWMHDRSDSPWYPSMRLFRQIVPGDWETVMKKMCVELRHTLVVQRR